MMGDNRNNLAGRRQDRRPAVEGLESRVLMHGGPAGVVYPIGTMVPWLTPPITPAGSPSPTPTPTTPTPTTPTPTTPTPTTPTPTTPTPTTPTPTTPTPTGTTVGTVSGLTLVNATSDADVGPLVGGATLDFANGAAAFSVRAEVIGSTAPVGSIQFLLDGQLIRTESTAPYSVAGDTAGDYAPWSVANGPHTLTALPFAGANATGDVGSPLTVSITVANAPAPTPTPTGFTKLTYVTKAANPQGRAEALTATWNNRLYVFGGYGKDPATNKDTGPVARSDYYDPATNAWTRVADLPQLITHAGVAEDADSVYFVAGYTGTGKGYGQVFGSNKVWRYDFAANAYTALPNLPRALSGGGAALLGRKLHYFGGFELANRGDSTVHLVLDLDNPSAGWKPAAAMTNTRSHLGVAVVGGKIYAVGGQTGYDAGLTTHNTVQVYDPATDAWTTMAGGMPTAVSHIHSATFVMGDRILVMGGESAHENAVRTVYAYTPATNAWQTLTLLPAARFSGVATTINGKIYFTTGGLQTTTWEVTPTA